MKNSFFRIINKLILVLLALLGFSCDPDDGYVEYGMPNADFKVQGTIIDVSTLQKLSGIEVVMDYDTAYSDVDGNYEVKVNAWPESETFVVTFKDIDEAANGLYLEADTIVDFTDVEFINGSSPWYYGEKSKEINIKLSPDDSK
ncbi:radical SAM-associated putative lipoprotein [Bacteroidota bacterium]